MSLETADWQDLLAVFRETYKIWSPGLSRRDYLEYQIAQSNHPWARRNIRHLTWNQEGAIVSSLKLSSINMQVRGQSFLIGGIGAVYTQLKFRNKGYASDLMEACIDLAKSESFHGLLLFSDIDCSFYERYGFEELGAADLLINLPFVKGKPTFPPHIQVDEDGSVSVEVDKVVYKLQSERFKQTDLQYASRYYGRWLRRQPYGIYRDPLYYSYKLMRETYLHEHSRLAWPALTISTVSADGSPSGYAITENAGGVLRILEIAAEQKVREAIWCALFVRALTEKFMRIRAWEGMAADFAPGFNLKQLINKCGLSELLPQGYKGQLNYYNRTWGKGMLLAFDEDLSHLHMTAPCPLVELDHL